MGSVELHTVRGTDGLESRGKISFGITGNVRDYNFKITPTNSRHSISSARPMREKIKGRSGISKGSITRRRQRDGSLIGTFTKIDGNFSIRVTLKN